MVSVAIWVLVTTVSLCAVCIAVAFDAHTLHLMATALVSLGIVAAAVNEHRTAELEGHSKYQLAAMASRYMGVLWAWSGISAYIVYAFLISWTLWLPVVIAMFILCVTFLFAAIVLDRETLARVPDSTASAMVGLLAKGQFVLGAIMFGAMFALRSQPVLGLDGPGQWVAFNLILCSAAAMMTLTGYLIHHESEQVSAAAADPAA